MSVPTISTFKNVAASATDSSLVAAIPGASIEVVGVVVNQGDTSASSVTFNTKGSGSGTAISAALKGPANGGFVLPTGSESWFSTNKGEALTVTTGSGSTTGIQIVYRLAY